jgi:gliding motility-associated-like protein
MKKNYLLCLLLLTFSCFAQFSKTHYIPPLSASNSTSSSAQEQYLYISTPNVTPVNFKIIALGGSVTYGTVSKNAPYVFNIGFGNNTQLMMPKSQVSSIVSNKGYIVEAEDLVYVAARVIAGSTNQAGALVSKGLAALGTQFRIGALLNTAVTSYSDWHYTFVSILATENNTQVQFNDIRFNASLINNGGVGNTPASITLNSGESYVMAVEGPHAANRDALIGSSVTSDKPIAVNCGSFTGTNASGNLDTGFDQIVSKERTGQEYIFIKSTGQAVVERVLLIADEDATPIYLNGNTGLPDYTLNHGDYIALDGNDFGPQGNMYVRSTKNIFAYQTIGDNSRTDFANQELFFVPPLSCETPHVIDNIPLVTQIGTRTFPIARITLVTEAGSTVNFEINGIPFTIATLNFLPGVSITGPIAVAGNANYVTYSITGISGNVAAFSTSQLYMAAYGTDGAATFGGYYSGFTFKPEISFALLDVTQTNCIPNTELSVNSLSPFDVFQWYFNGADILGANSSSYTPLQPGYYYVKATIANCGTTLISDQIPVSSCPANFDNDLANDNIDPDNDNDGITDCTESLGDQNVDLSNSAALSVVTTGSAAPSPTPFIGTANGEFVTQTPIGKNNTVSFKKDFAQPTSIGLEYVATANTPDLLNSDSEFILNCDVSKTITVLNPNNQLLIDTNFDGIYESGVTKFSSFEIRFRLDSPSPLPPGAGTFKFRSSLTTSISLVHKNLSDINASNATFKLIATCVAKDSDSDGVTDNFDSDSDNDGISDNIEAQGPGRIAFSNVDTNGDGLDDAFGLGQIPIDTDLDGVPDYLDSDSDNDGIYDLIESGSTASDVDMDGFIDGSPASFGSNGMSDSVETTPDSAMPNYTVADTDADGVDNYLELDNDGDACFDTVEAGYTDADSNGFLGDIPAVVNTHGVITNSFGYLPLPNSNYIITAPIAITTQPIVTPTCFLEDATISIITTAVDSYQWEVFMGGVWTNITNNAVYSGATTNTLQINNVALPMDGFKYRVQLQKIGNSCGLLSDETTLTVYDLPVITMPISLIQCDEDAVSDGITDINLRQKESFISANYLSENFTYYTSPAAAQAGDVTAPEFIANPTQYNSGNTSVWARVANANLCFRIARLNITVTATRIPASFHRNFYQCDDFLDTNGNNNANNNNRDGIATFNFSSITASLIALLPASSSFTIKYYKNAADASAETDDSGDSLEISQNASDPISIYHYRNIEYPNQQQVWARVESNVDNACFGLGAYISLIVEPLPVVNRVNTDNIIRHCDDDQDGSFGFNTSAINSAILNGQTNVALSYFDAAGNVLPSPLPNPFVVNSSQTITVKATNTATQAPDGPCFTMGSFQFIVDDLPQAFPIAAALMSSCDDEADPAVQDGKIAFNTATFEATILNGQTGLIVSYKDGSGNPLPSPLPNPFVTATHNVTVTVENPINPTCKATLVLPFVVYPLPKIDLNTNGSENGLICTNLPELTVTLTSGVMAGTPTSDYTYQWYLDGTALADITPTITVNTGGIYTVDVTNAFGCQRTRTIKVSISEIPTIEDIKVVDLSDINTVELIVSGTGDYVYSLDYEDSYQDSNFFANVTSGIHQVYVKDLNGCGLVGPIEIYVLGIPKFFTPNGDGYNDTWNIKGVNEKFNKTTMLRIFDRYGKLIKQIYGVGKGWDGTFNGNDLPADDYWYVITLEDNRIIKGHFALKR